MNASTPPVPPKPASAYRILHTADWHLGKLLGDKSRDEEHARFLGWLLAEVESRRVDAIILAGDVFDSANPPQSALARYYDFVSDLHKLGGCSLAVLSGNHDSATLLEAPKRLLRALDVHIAGYLEEDPKRRWLFLPDGANPRVAVALLPFLRDRDLRAGKFGESAEEIRACITKGIQSRYAETAEAVNCGCPVLATGHLTVVGSARVATDSEREIHIGGLGAIAPEAFPATFSYVALGHLHRPHAVDSGGRIRYAGSPIPLSFSEANDCKEVRILDVFADRIEHYALPVPAARKLVQLRTTRVALESALAACNLQPGDLSTWVEVVVEDAAFDSDLVEQVRGLAEGRDFEVLKVMRASVGMPAGVAIPGDRSEGEISGMLEKPEDVFQSLLERQPHITEEERESLKLAFSALHELVKESGDCVLP